MLLRARMLLPCIMLHNVLLRLPRAARVYACSLQCLFDNIVMSCAALLLCAMSCILCHIILVSCLRNDILYRAFLCCCCRNVCVLLKYVVMSCVLPAILLRHCCSIMSLRFCFFCFLCARTAHYITYICNVLIFCGLLLWYFSLACFILINAINRMSVYSMCVLL